MTCYYSADGITIYRGDARLLTEWLSADVLVTDPPYGMAYVSGWQDRTIAGDQDTAARDAVLTMWGDKPALVFGRWDVPHPKAARTMLTWDKGNWPGMGDLKLPWGPSTEEIYVLGHGFIGKRTGSVLRAKRLVGETRHPNEKPLWLMAQLIQACPPGVIADPFAGSGTTLIAARAAGRRAVGVEIDDAHCKTIVSRLAQTVLF